VILEFAVPASAVLRRLYLLYFNRIMPALATLVSRDRSGAYRYLPRSVLSFSGDEAIRSALMSAGFANVAIHRRSCGIVALYVAVKAC
jgi:demethylmenaquinone methyltransferase/2-methoxy-6-polyprenyl-1,4-benzoquinol methylase